MIMKKICLLQFFIQVITCYEESYQKCDVIKKRPKNSYEKNRCQVQFRSRGVDKFLVGRYFSAGCQKLKY